MLFQRKECSPRAMLEGDKGALFGEGRGLLRDTKNIWPLAPLAFLQTCNILKEAELFWALEYQKDPCSVSSKPLPLCPCCPLLSFPSPEGSPSQAHLPRGQTTTGPHQALPWCPAHSSSSVRGALRRFLHSLKGPLPSQNPAFQRPPGLSSNHLFPTLLVSTATRSFRVKPLCSLKNNDTSYTCDLMATPGHGKKQIFVFSVYR